MHLHQQGAVCGQGGQGCIAQLLAAVGCVLLQAWTVWGQGGHTMIMDPSAIWDFNLCHILPSRGYFYQEIVVYLSNTVTDREIRAIRNKQICQNYEAYEKLMLTCCRPLRSICFQKWKSKQRSLQYLQTSEAHRQRSFTVKWDSTCKEAKTHIIIKGKSYLHWYITEW